jgi:hypothetical protein
MAASVAVRAQARPPVDPVELEVTLARAAERVVEFFTRAQSLVVTETVYHQPINAGLSGDGPGRSIESELRLSWTPDADGDAATEAQTLRLLSKVNGRKPRSNDRRNCTTQEQFDTETQVLSMLLPRQRDEYTWRLAGRGKVDGRTAILIDFQQKRRLEVNDVRLLEDNEDCVIFNVEGGRRGRVWVDAESYDVLRMDHHLGGQVEIELPRKLRNRAGANPSWTLDRLDTTYRFKRVRFQDPEETLVLPVSSNSLRIYRNGGAQSLRTSVEYKGYRRFMTGGRIIQTPQDQD